LAEVSSHASFDTVDEMRAALLLCGLAATACSSDPSGPIFAAGPWHGSITGSDSTWSGTITLSASSDGGAALLIEGTRGDPPRPFRFQGEPLLLKEGVSFMIAGQSGDTPIGGVGRVRVLDDMLYVLVPVDDAPEHALLVNGVAWTFHLQGGVGPLGAQGVFTATDGTDGLSGTFELAPGEAPDAGPDARPDAGSDAAVDGAGLDAAARD
jgi:hypothetical protein